MSTTCRWPDVRYLSILFSAAEPGCLSQIPDPDFYPSRIPDPKTLNSNKKEGAKKFVVLRFFLAAHKYHKIETYFIFELEEKHLGQIQEL